MKKLVTISLVGMFGIALVSSAALANYGDDNSLKGYVKVKGALQPVNKAKVTLHKTNGKKVDSDKTDAKGKYSFSDLSEKKYVLKVQAAGFRSPKNAKKTKVSYTVKVDGKTKKNAYLIK